MKTIARLLVKYKIFLLHILGPLGFWGAGLISLVDAASIPVPMEIIMAGYVLHDPHRFYLYTILAAIGAAVGGLVPFLLGRAGGELFLLRHVNRAKYEQMLHRFEKQEFVAMLIPSMLPPPTPWKAFVFAAGVFEMPVALFLLSVFTGRVIRFTIEALLVIHYGPQVTHLITDVAQRHTVALMVSLGIVVALLVIWSLRKRFGARPQVPASH